MAPVGLGLDFMQHFSKFLRAVSGFNCWAVILLIISAIMVGCGGSGSSPATFLTPGTLTFEKEIVSDGTAFELTDAGSIIKISGSAGAVTTGGKAKLQVWSEQRALAKLTNFTATRNAIDLTVSPSSLGSSNLTVKMPGQGSDSLSTMIVLFGPNGTRMALPLSPSSTPAALEGYLNSKMISFVTGVPATSNEPVKIQFAVETISDASRKPTEQVVATAPKLNRAWTAPATRTSYAGKKRIAIIVPGSLDSAANANNLVDFVAGIHEREGVPAEKSNGYDAVDVFDYDWTQPWATTGNQLAQIILSQYASSDKFEVEIFAHDVGGLISREAIEAHGVSSVKVLTTFASAHQGIPLDILQSVIIQLGPQAGTGGLPPLAGLRAGLSQMKIDSTALIAVNSRNPNSATTYRSVAAREVSWTPFGSRLGEVNNIKYNVATTTTNDGFVSLASAGIGDLKIVNFNHLSLIRNGISSYFPNTGANGWIKGMNRRIKQLSAAFGTETVSLGNSLAITLTALDLDGTKLDPELIFDPTTSETQPAIVWTVDDPSIVSVTGKSKLNANVNGLKVGDTVVRAKDPVSGIVATIAVKVVDANILILPNKPELQLGESKRFTVGMVTGEIPSGTIINWTLQGDGTINGGKTVSSTAAFVDYVAPNSAVTDRISVELRNPTTNNLIGSTSTTIRVGASFRIVPNGKVVPTGGFQKFSVEAVGSGALPQGGSFRWTVTGGTLESSTTTAPNVNYTAPSTQSDQTISVDVLNADGSSAGTASASMLIRPGGMKFTVANINAFMDSDIPNGNYDDPLYQAVVGNVGDVDRVGLTFFVDELTVDGETPGLAIQLAIPVGSKLSAGQTFTVGQVNVPGRFYVIGTTIFIRPGTFTINTVTPNSDGTFTYTFSISLNAWIDNTATTEATILTGTGSFTLAY